MAFDRTDPADLLALKNEIANDPDGLGYLPGSTQQGVLDVINLARPTYTVSKPKISAANVRSATTYDAYNALLADEQEWLRWITGSNGVNEESLVVTPDLRTQLTDAADSIWSAGTKVVMNAAMLALIDIDGSRAEDLFGFGTVISRDDWFEARDS